MYVYVFRTVGGTEAVTACDECSSKMPPVDGVKTKRYPAVLPGRCELCHGSGSPKPARPGVITGAKGG